MSYRAAGDDCSGVETLHLDSGDRVIASEPLGGGFFRPRVPAGTGGLVLSAGRDWIDVAFVNGRNCRVTTTQVRPLPAGASLTWSIRRRDQVQTSARVAASG